MKARVRFVVPGSIDQPTGGYGYDRRIVEGLRARGRSVDVVELVGTFPLADARARAAAEDCLADTGDELLVIDGLALPAFDRLAESLPAAWIALIHHPLALETGIPAHDAETLAASERRLLQRATRIITSSEATRRDLAMYEVESARIGAVPPGTDPAPLARGSAGPGLALLCVGALVPRKGHLVLLEALGHLRDLDWRLVCIGPERDPAHAAAVRALRADLGLRDRVELLGERRPAELERHYDRADLFVLASHHEGYGMVLSEALARGLPVVSTTAGAIPDTVPRGAGLFVSPGDAAALAAALREVMTDAGRRADLAAGARAARSRLPDWADASRRFAAELERMRRGDVCGTLASAARAV